MKCKDYGSKGAPHGEQEIIEQCLQSTLPLVARTLILRHLVPPQIHIYDLQHQLLKDYCYGLAKDKIT